MCPFWVSLAASPAEGSFCVLKAQHYICWSGVSCSHTPTPLGPPTAGIPRGTNSTCYLNTGGAWNKDALTPANMPILCHASFLPTSSCCHSECNQEMLAGVIFSKAYHPLWGALVNAGSLLRPCDSFLLRAYILQKAQWVQYLHNSSLKSRGFQYHVMGSFLTFCMLCHELYFL